MFPPHELVESPLAATAAAGVLGGENNPERHGSVLYTEQTFHDVVFEAEVKWSKGAVTGVMLRLKDLLVKPDNGTGKGTFYSANQVQVQIGTSGSLKRDMTGSLYVGGSERYLEKARGNGVDEVLKLDDWNRIRFEARGDLYKVWVDGKQVTEYTDARFAGRAPLGLQVHPGNVMKAEFRERLFPALSAGVVGEQTAAGALAVSPLEHHTFKAIEGPFPQPASTTSLGHWAPFGTTPAAHMQPVCIPHTCGPEPGLFSSRFGPRDLPSTERAGRLGASERAQQRANSARQRVLRAVTEV